VTSAEGVRARRAALSAAEMRLHELTQGERVAAIGRVLDAWSDAASPLRRRLLDEHPRASGLSPANLAAGLELALATWDGAALERLVAAEAAGAAPLTGITGVVHGGVLPMPTLLDALAPLVLGSPVLAKPTARDPVTPRLVAASVAELAPELGDCIAVADVRRGDAAALTAILAARRVVVTGGDQAVAAVATRLPPGTALIPHGHKLSVAILGASTTLEDAAARLAIDVSLWDQLGCLSPVACWVVGGPARARAFARALADALEAREAVAPRGEVDAAAEAWIAAERSEAELRAAAGREIGLHAGRAWTVVAEAEAAPRPAPLHRFVRVHPIGEAADLPRVLAPLRPHLAGLAHAGLDLDAACALARAIGATRAAPFGELQAPPLDWARDGLGVLASLRSTGPPAEEARSEAGM